MVITCSTQRSICFKSYGIRLHIVVRKCELEIMPSRETIRIIYLA